MLLILTPFLASGQVAEGRSSLPPFDRRLEREWASSTRSAEETFDPAQAEALLRQRLPGVWLDRHALFGSPQWLAARDGFLTGPRGKGRAMPPPGAAQALLAAPEAHQVVRAFLDEFAGLFGHASEVLDAALIKRDYTAAHSGLRTTVWQQQVADIEVFDAVLLAHVTRNGELVNLASQFLPDPLAAARAGDEVFALTGSVLPSLSAPQALALACQNLGASPGSAEDCEILASPLGAEARQTLRNPTTKGEASARLAWLPLHPGTLRLCWRITLTCQAAHGMYTMLVDAQTGEIWLRRCLTEDISDATYRVFTKESPSPLLPGYSSQGQATQPATVSRSLIKLAALDAYASPFGWINDGDNETRGNNVDAHTDLDDDDTPDTPRPQGSPARTFDFPLELTKSPASYRPAAVVNLFYWCNWMHDKLYAFGFTEEAGNFQNNNFNRGGQGNDAVSADAQDGGGVNNANFSTPEDGYAPRMQMYVFDSPAPDRDGDFDATVILHEYTHGLSNRRVGGGVGLSKSLAKGLGEGWSDFYALSLLMDAGDSPDACYPAGAYVMQSWAGWHHDLPFASVGDNYYFGIRRYPYSTDLAKNPLTLRNIGPFVFNPPPDIPVAPSIAHANASEVHMVGEVWCAMLWECRAEMIKKHGFASGHQLIMQLVTDGMGLSPPDPTFVQAREAILQADKVLTGGANWPELRRAFAKRGLGYYALSPSNSSPAGTVEDFEIGPGLRIVAPSTLEFLGPEGGPFNDLARTFTLINDSAAPLSWNVMVDAPLETPSTSGTLSPGQSRSINLTLDANAAAQFPIGEYTLSVLFSNVTTHTGHAYPFILTVHEAGESLTEVFGEIDSQDKFDLLNRQLTFRPVSSRQYAVCREIRLTLPTSTANAHTVDLTNQSLVPVPLSNGKRVVLFGHSYNQVWISRYGSVQLSAQEIDNPTLAAHFAAPQVAGFFHTFNPAGGRISWEQLPDRLVTTWENVMIGQLTNQFQIEMFFEGPIQISWVGNMSYWGIMGLSAGGGEPLGWSEAHFSARPDCDLPPLTLTLPEHVSEGLPLRAGTALVSIPRPRDIPTVVNLSSSDTSELTVPASVVIPARQTSASIDLQVVDDLVFDGSQLVYITATALNHLAAQAAVRVDDSEDNPLTVNIPLLATEAGGEFAGTVSVPHPVSGTATVSLSSSDTNEITVPSLVFIPAGQTTAVFHGQIIDDHRIDGTRQTSVAASVPGWTSGSDALSVLDNENRELHVIAPLLLTEGGGTLTNVGQVYLSGTLPTDLTVTLASSNFLALLPLGPVTIRAGQTNAFFSIGVGDNADLDDVRFVALTAAAPAFTSATWSVVLFDNDHPPVPANPYPPDGATNWSLNTHLAWDAAEGELVTNGNFERGDFSGWNVSGYGGGGWVLNHGEVDPVGPDGPRAPLSGGFSAMVVQNGNGLHTLHRAVQIPDGVTSSTQLRWRHEVRNHGGAFGPHQRFAVELRDAESDTILATLYTTSPSDAAIIAPADYSASMAPWRGQRVRIVFVEEDQDGALNVQVDDVSLIATSAAPTTYDVYFGTDPAPDATEYLGSTTSASWDLLPLAGGLNYYWRIDSRRSGFTNTGPVWHFSTAASSAATAPLTFGTSWKYAATGANLGTAWRAANYDDRTWPSATAPLGFGSTETTTIGLASNDYTTFYFRRRVAIAETNRLATATFSLKRDDGAIVYINGVEAFRDNMPAGRLDYLTQATAIINGADETNAVAHAVDPGLFVEGTNVIAVEVHQRDNGLPLPGPSPDLFFDLALTLRTNVGNLPPLAVTWTTPADFATVQLPTNLVVQAQVQDDNLLGARVSFFADGIKLAEDAITPFQMVWTNPPAGQHVLQAVVTDTGGLTLPSSDLHVLIQPPAGQNVVTIVSPGSVWRYRQNGEFPGTTWTTPLYDEPRDHSWASGPAQLGYGDGDEATTFDFPFLFGSRPITSYFRHSFTLDAQLSALSMRIIRDDGAAVYLDGTEIWRNNLPSGRLAEDTLALRSLSPPEENTWQAADLSSVRLAPGRHLLAVEVHQASANNGDLSFDLELTGVGNLLPTVQLTAPSHGSVWVGVPAVVLRASAEDAYGAVSRVEFFSDGLLLGSVSTPPYEFTWNHPPAGAHTLTAVATDNLGATRVSAAAVMTVVLEAPLSIQVDSGQSVLSWPAQAPGFLLETTTNLTPPVQWQPDTNTVEQIDGQFRVRLQNNEALRFYRLRAP